MQRQPTAVATEGDDLIARAKERAEGKPTPEGVGLPDRTRRRRDVPGPLAWRHGRRGEQRPADLPALGRDGNPASRATTRRWSASSTRCGRSRSAAPIVIARGDNYKTQYDVRRASASGFSFGVVVEPNASRCRGQAISATTGSRSRWTTRVPTSCSRSAAGSPPARAGDRLDGRARGRGREGVHPRRGRGLEEREAAALRRRRRRPRSSRRGRASATRPWSRRARERRCSSRPTAASSTSSAELHGLPRAAADARCAFASRRRTAGTSRRRAARPLKIQLAPDGVTVSADGYLVFAGALHPTGIVYRRSRRRRRRARDDAAASSSRRRAARARATRERMDEALDDGRADPEGPSGDDTIFHLALELAREGKPRAEILEQALRVNREQCRPPRRRGPRPQSRWTAPSPTRAGIRLPRRSSASKAREVLEARRGAGRSRRRRPRPQRTRGGLGGAGADRDPRRRCPRFDARAAARLARPTGRPRSRAEKGAALDLGANLALGVVSGGIARHVQVSPRPGWYEPIEPLRDRRARPGAGEVARSSRRRCGRCARSSGSGCSDWEEHERLVDDLGRDLREAAQGPRQRSSRRTTSSTPSACER